MSTLYRGPRKRVSGDLYGIVPIIVSTGTFMVNQTNSDLVSSRLRFRNLGFPTILCWRHNQIPKSCARQYRRGGPQTQNEFWRSVWCIKHVLAYSQSSVQNGASRDAARRRRLDNCVPQSAPCRSRDLWRRYTSSSLCVR